VISREQRRRLPVSRTVTSKARREMRPSTSSVTGREDLKNDDGRKRPGSFAPLRWLRTRLSEAVGQVRARVRDSARSVIRSLLPRAVGWLREKIGSPVRLIKSAVMATIGKDRGFAFWWLVVTAVIALAVGLLVAALVSPVIGILAALGVGIWMLIRRNRSSQSRKTAQAHLAS
jgi:hypothetical protein